MIMPDKRNKEHTISLPEALYFNRSGLRQLWYYEIVRYGHPKRGDWYLNKEPHYRTRKASRWMLDKTVLIIKPTRSVDI